MSRRSKSSVAQRATSSECRSQFVFASLRTAGSMKLALSELKQNYTKLQWRYHLLEKTRDQLEQKLLIERARNQHDNRSLERQKPILSYCKNIATQIDLARSDDVSEDETGSGDDNVLLRYLGADKENNDRRPLQDKKQSITTSTQTDSRTTPESEKVIPYLYVESKAPSLTSSKAIQTERQAEIELKLQEDLRKERTKSELYRQYMTADIKAQPTRHPEIKRTESPSSYDVQFEEVYGHLDAITKRMHDISTSSPFEKFA